MIIPKLLQTARLETLITAFGGLDRSGRIAEGRFRDSLNLSGDALPLLRVRNPRGRWVQVRGGSADAQSGLFVFSEPIRGAASLDGGLCWATDTKVYIGGRQVPGVALTASAHKQLVPMGRDLFIAPDGVLLHETNGVWTVQTVRNRTATTNGDTLTVSLAESDGTALVPAHIGTEPPASPANGTVWLDTSGSEPTIRVRSDAADAWVERTTVYVALQATGLGDGFRKGDAVTVAGLTRECLNGEVILTAATADTLVFPGVLPAALETQTAAVTVTRRMPCLDFAVEHDNRLWGCRCGLNDRGEYVNEIYASALGDGLNWFRYRGLSTDSYTASLGIPGAFTGAAVCGREVLFFKEDAIVRISGTEPSDFHVTAAPAKGIRAGCHLSAANLGERLFYRAADGIYVYDGALPYRVSEALGTESYTDAAAGAVNGKYYIAMTDGKGERNIYVFDPANGEWFKEDDRYNTAFLLAQRNALYLLEAVSTVTLLGVTMHWYAILVNDIDAPGKYTNILVEPGKTEADYGYVSCGNVSWFAETGDLGLASQESKKLRQIRLRVQLAEESELRVAIAADGMDEWRELAVVNGGRKGSFTVPVRTPRCDSFRLRLSGKGDCTVSAVRLVAEKTNGGERHI